MAEIRAKARVLVVDDHRVVAEGLGSLLTDRGFELVGIAADAESALQMAQNPTDVVLMDISMPGMSGIEAARIFRLKFPGVRIILLTMHTHPQYVREGIRAGASGYVLKRSAASEIIQAIYTVMSGRIYVGKELSASDLGDAELTPRQTQVLRLIALGHSAKEIAHALRIAVKTAEFHKTSIMDRLNLRSTAALTRYAMTLGVLEAEPLGRGETTSPDAEPPGVHGSRRTPDG